MATLGGQVTLAGVELKTQSWYMAFQVIQVFLITTFSSGAASSAAQIVSNPSSATTLLAENLPKASNFFISYLILQGLGIAASQLLNVGALVMLTVVGKFLDKSPRKMFRRYITLGGLGWGDLYPKVGNLGIIGTSPIPQQRVKLTPRSNFLFNHRTPRPRFRHYWLRAPLPRRPLQLLLRSNQQRRHQRRRLREGPPTTNDRGLPFRSLPYRSLRHQHCPRPYRPYGRIHRLHNNLPRNHAPRSETAHGLPPG